MKKEIEETKKQLECEDDAIKEEKKGKVSKLKASDVLMRGAGEENIRPFLTRAHQTEVNQTSQKNTPRRQTSMNK